MLPTATWSAASSTNPPRKRQGGKSPANVDDAAGFLNKLLAVGIGKLPKSLPVWRTGVLRGRRFV